MMSEQIQSRLDEQQKAFKGVEEQLSSNLKEKEDECKEEIYPLYYYCTTLPILTAARRAQQLQNGIGVPQNSNATSHH